VRRLSSRRDRRIEAAGSAVTRAVVRAMLAAETTTTPWGTVRSYIDAFPSALT